MALVSVIVPIYKVERYLSDCIESILQQSFRDFELILVDDGSPDNCGKICEHYKENAERYGIDIQVIHRENGGLSAARNSGIDWAFENSKSDWLTFIDSDDAIVKNYLELLYKAGCDNDAQIATCLSSKVTDENMSFNYLAAQTESIVLSGRDACIEQYTSAKVVKEVAWGKLYKKELFTSLRYPVGKINEDDFTTPILLYNAVKVACLNAPLYLYRYREDSIMNEQFSIRRYDGIEAYTFCEDYFSKKNENEIVEHIELKKKMTIAYFSLLASKNGILDSVPINYRMSEKESLRYIKENCSSIEYDYFLDILHHRRVIFRAYARKLGLIK